MANPEWLEIFRSFTPDELTAHVTALKEEISVYATQAIGQKSYTKDLGELRGQLASAIRVQTERANSTTQPGFMLTDFSRRTL